MFARLMVLALILAASAFAQAKSTIAPKVTTTAINIDGNLDESYWVNAGVGEKFKVDNDVVVYGTIDGDADCYAEFKTLWSDNGIYVGTWFYDDIHNAMNSQYVDAANIAYDDDGLEYWFDYNFDDAYNSTATSQAQYYLQLVKGFGNLDPATQFGGWWGGDDGSGKGWSTAVKTVAEQQAMGWREVFTSADGLNYTSELLIEWSGSIMHQVGTRSQGDAIAFDMKVNDNDGAFTIEGGLHWSDLSHGATYGQHFGKITMGPAAGIKPVAMKSFRSAPTSGNSFYDIQGRKINRSAATNVPRFVIENSANTSKRLIVR